MPALRRSGRTAKRTHHDQYVDVDDVISSEDSESEQEEEEYEEQPSKKRAKSEAKDTTKAKKKPKVDENALQLENEKNSYLFQAIVSDDSSINEIVSNWLEEFESDGTLAVKNLLNYILVVCGCIYQIEEHDVANLESANQTIGEIQTLFQRQSLYKFNDKNLVEFFEQLIVITNESGLLYDQDVQLFEILLTWLSCLSLCNIRPFRLVSTTILLNIETELISIISNLDKNLKNLEKQLSKTKKTAKARKVVQDHVTENQNQKLTIEDYIKDILNTIFIHRYKDIDPIIRKECLIHLTVWIEKYPIFFLNSNYLRYYGWLLFDSSSVVQLQVVKSLNKLYKSKDLILGLKQFTERFKSSFVDIYLANNSSLDKHLNGLIVELIRHDFLDETEIIRILNLKNDQKLLEIYESKTFKEVQEKNSSLIKNSDKDMVKYLKYRNLLNILKQTSYRDISGLKKSDYIDIEFLINYLKEESSISLLQLDEEDKMNILRLVQNFQETDKSTLISNLNTIYSNLKYNSELVDKFIEIFDNLEYQDFKLINNELVYDNLIKEILNYYQNEAINIGGLIKNLVELNSSDLNFELDKLIVQLINLQDYKKLIPISQYKDLLDYKKFSEKIDEIELKELDDIKLIISVMLKNLDNQMPNYKIIVSNLNRIFEEITNDVDEETELVLINGFINIYVLIDREMNDLLDIDFESMKEVIMRVFVRLEKKLSRHEGVELGEAEEIENDEEQETQPDILSVEKQFYSYLINLKKLMDSKLLLDEDDGKRIESNKQKFGELFAKILEA